MSGPDGIIIYEPPCFGSGEVLKRGIFVFICAGTDHHGGVQLFCRFLL